MISQVGYLAWAGLAATLLSSVLAQRDAAIATLANERGQLAAHALSAEQRERRRLAELLHDESVQTLALAQQELGDYHRTGRDASFERARAAIAETMAQLRGEIFELHPYVLDHAGLPAALRAIADRCAERMGARITVAVDPAATGPHDELVVVLARELLSNATKHSGASRVVLTVAADSERVELEVRDDGPGFDPARRTGALAAGAHRPRLQRAARAVGGRRARRRDRARARDHRPRHAAASRRPGDGRLSVRPGYPALRPTVTRYSAYISRLPSVASLRRSAIARISPRHSSQRPSAVSRSRALTVGP